MSDRAPVPRWRIALMVALFALPAYALVRVKRTELVDFAVYRTAAIRAVHAEPLYRPEDGHYQFKYLPAFALAMMPVAFVDKRIAEVCWSALIAGLLAWYLRYAVDVLPDRRRTIRWLVWLTVLVTAKFWIKELVMGQANVVLATLLAGALAAARAQRRALAGALVGLGVIVKPYALLFVPWIAWTSGATALVAATGVLAGALVVPAVVYGWQGNLAEVSGWVRTVTDTTAPNLLDAENVSLSTMWAKWLGPGGTASTLGGVSIVLALAAAGAIVRAGRGLREPRYLELAALAMLVPVISPQGWDYVLVIAVPAFVCLLDRFGDLSRGWRLTTLIGIALTSFTVFDLVGRHVYLWLMSVSAVTIGIIVLVAVLGHLRGRRLA